MILKPHGYQQLIIDHQIEEPRSATWCFMGGGKTVATLTTIDARQLGGAGPALVLAPLRVARSTWPDEAAKWDHLSGMEVSPIVGTPEQRLKALRDPNAGVFTINYENLPWLIDALKSEKMKWPFDIVVPDESTRLKSFRLRGGSKRARVLARIARRSRYWMNLTGTPAPNGLLDVWGQQWFVDHGSAIGHSYTAYTRRWFMADNPHSDHPTLVPRPFAEDEIYNKLRQTCLTVKAEDWFDVEEPLVSKIYVDLPGKARKIYDKMEREMFAEISGHEVEAVTAAAKSNKCGQLAQGFAFTDAEGHWTGVHDAKLQALESVITEAAGNPIIVAYHYKPDLVRLRKAFPQGRVLDNKDSTIRDWNAGKIPILFAHPASAGHGLNLQDGGHRLVFFGVDWNLEYHDQIIERIGPVRQLQAGHDRLVYIYYILARHTVDEQKMLRFKTKRSVQDLLMEAMRRK